MSPKQCPAITSRGTQCQGYVHAGHDWCPAHDPARAEARRRSASKAGRSKQGGEIATIKQKLKELYDDTRSGKIPTNVGQVCGTIAGVQLKVLDTEVREREVVIKEREFVEVRLPEFQQLQNEVAELKEMLARKGTENGRARSWAG